MLESNILYHILLSTLYPFGDTEKIVISHVNHSTLLKAHFYKKCMCTVQSVCVFILH